MGSIVSGIGGLFGGGSNPNSSASSIAGLGQISGEQQQLAGQLDTQGSDIFGPAFGQYTGGISGQLTPAQSSLVQQNLGAMDAATAGNYGNLGLGGSTMETQDQNANALRSMAQESNINFQNESLGLQGLQQALGYFGGAEGALGGAGTSIGNAGRLQAANTEQLNNAISSLGNKSAGGLGSGVQSIGSGIGSALGLGGGSGAAGAAGAGAVDAGTFDLGGAAATGAGALGGDALLGAAGTDALGAGTAAAGGKGAADLIPALALAA